MNKIVIDSSAWIEYFAGTAKGRKIKEFLDGQDTLPFVTELIASEVMIAFSRAGIACSEALEAIKSRASLVHSDYRIAADASVLAHSRKLNIIDAHSVAAARAVGGKLITCNTHFSGLSEALVIK